MHEWLFEYDIKCETTSTSFWLKIMVSEHYWSGILWIYIYVFMWVIYKRLQIDIWTVDHLCDRITYNPFWIWTCYPDILIGLVPPTLWTSFPDLFRADHPQQRHLSPYDSILLLCAIWVYVICSFLLLSLSLFYYDLTYLYSSRYRIKFRIMIMF